MPERRLTPLVDQGAFLSHFSLEAEPFGLGPDPRFHYPSTSQRSALSAIESLTESTVSEPGIVLIVGDAGTGKTTLVNVAFEHLRSLGRVALRTSGSFEFDDMLSRALVDAEPDGRAAPPPPERKGKKKGRAKSGKAKEEPPASRDFDALLERTTRRGESVTLFVDEAQNLSASAAASCLALTERREGAPGLHLVLVGQPAIEQRTTSGDLSAIGEAVARRCRLERLTRAESLDYVRNRLQIAGGDPEIFEPTALRVLVGAARRHPRRLNVLCHRSMWIAYSTGNRRVDAATARLALRHLRGKYEKRSPRVPARVVAVGATVALASFAVWSLRGEPEPPSASGAVATTAPETSRDRSVGEPSEVAPPPTVLASVDTTALERRETAGERRDPPVVDADPVAASRAERSNAEEPPAPLVRVDSTAVARSIVEREPQGVGDRFLVEVGDLFFWNRLSTLDGPTRVEHVWIYEGSEAARIPLEVGGSYWRVWSTKRIDPGQAGDWRVEIVDERGTTLERVAFTVGQQR